VAVRGRRFYTVLEAPVANVIVEEWTVLGMTCGGCAATVEQSLAQVPGLRRVTADHSTDRVKLEFDVNTMDRSFVKDRIEAAGFDMADHG